MTKIKISIDDEIIPATLNDTLTAREFVKILPFKTSACKSQYDYCGVGEELDYDESEIQAGWKNGDIGYARGWFALFITGEEESSSYTSEMIIGHIDDEYLDTVQNLKSNVSILVELDG